MSDHRSRYGFSASDLLIVIAIIGILIALLLPALSAARESARRSHCSSNLRNVATATIAYETDRGQFPTSAFYGKSSPLDTSIDKVIPGDAKGKQGVQAPYSLFVRLLPYMEQEAIYKRIDFEKPAFDDANAGLAATVVAYYLCPSYRGQRHSKAADYKGANKPAIGNYKSLGATTWTVLTDPQAVKDPNGDGGAIQPYVGRKPFNTASLTVLYCETIEEKYAAWWDGTAASIPGFHPEIDDKKATTPALNYQTRENPFFLGKKKFGGSENMVWGPSSEHPGHVLHVFADTHMQVFSDDIDADIYKAVITTKHTDNDVIGGFVR
jgi:type II secretory pathway pseudopilin PulG